MNQLAKRDEKTRARAVVAAQLTGQLNQMAGALGGFIHLSFWGRLRWFILGPAYVNTKGTVILLGTLVAAIAAVITAHYLVFMR